MNNSALAAKAQTTFQLNAKTSRSGKSWAATSKRTTGPWCGTSTSARLAKSANTQFKKTQDATTWLVQIANLNSAGFARDLTTLPSSKKKVLRSGVMIQTFAKRLWISWPPSVRRRGSNKSNSIKSAVSTLNKQILSWSMCTKRDLLKKSRKLNS